VELERVKANGQSKNYDPLGHYRAGPQATDQAEKSVAVQFRSTKLVARDSPNRHHFNMRSLQCGPIIAVARSTEFEL
jgi:hypothetical protein